MEISNLNIEQQVGHKLTWHQQAEAAALAKEQAAKEQAEIRALTEQFAAQAEAAQAQLQIKALDPTSEDFAEIASAPSLWQEGVHTWITTRQGLGRQQQEIYGEYAHRAFATGQRFAKLIGPDYTKQRLQEATLECLNEHFAWIDVWPTGAPPNTVNPFGIQVSQQTLYGLI